MITPYKIQELDNAGGAFTVDIDDPHSLFIYYGTAGALGAGITISPSGVPTKQVTVNIFYDANVTYAGGNTVTVFGTILSSERALKGLLWIKCVYNLKTARWMVSILDGFPDITNNSAQQIDMNMAAGQTVTLAQDSPEFTYMLSAGGTLLGNVAVTASAAPGDLTDDTHFIYKHDGSFDLGGSTYTVFGINIPASVCLAGDFMVIAYKVDAAGAVAAQLITANKGDELAFIVDVSFEASEQCNNSIVAPHDGTFTLLDSYVTKALAATDDGTVTVQINGTPVTTGVLTIAASAALDDHDTATPSGANTFSKGDVIDFVSAKTTTGGKAKVTARYTRI